MNYYNEFDLAAAAQLQALMDAGLIPKGHVDTRSITDVKPHELKGYIQCHFFAGIADGLSHSSSQGGPQTGQSGQGPVPVSRRPASSRRIYPCL